MLWLTHVVQVVARRAGIIGAVLGALLVAGCLRVGGLDVPAIQCELSSSRPLPPAQPAQPSTPRPASS